MGKTIERYNLNTKLCAPCFFFPRLLWHDGAQTPVHTGIHTHRHACALHMRVATTISAMNKKRLCPLVSHETDEPSSRPAKKQNSVLAATAVRPSCLPPLQPLFGRHYYVGKNSGSKAIRVYASLPSTRGGLGAA